MEISISLGLQDSEKWGDKDIKRSAQDAHINLPNPGGRVTTIPKGRPNFGKPKKQKAKAKEPSKNYSKDDVNVERIGKSQRYKCTDPKGKTKSTNWAGVQRMLRDNGITLTEKEIESLRG